MLINICLIYPNIDINGQWSKSKKLKKIAENSHVLTEANGRISKISTLYQSDIKAFCTPDIMSSHPLGLDTLERKHWGCKTMCGAILFPKFHRKLQMHFMVPRETKWLPINASASRSINMWAVSLGWSQAPVTSTKLLASLPCVFLV